MTMTSKPKTAAELLAELSANPAFLAQQQARECERLELERVLREAERPLVHALSEVGVVVNSVWDLVNTAAPYPQAVPILLDHLQCPYPDAVREGIARALAVPEAVDGWEFLTSMYRSEPVQRIKHGLAVAIAAAATDGVLED